MKRNILVVLSLVVILSILFTIRAANSQQKITEDDPRWDCKTMGNKICGKIELEPLYYVSHKGHFDAVNVAGVMLSEFETFKQLETFAQDKGFELVKGKPPIYCGAMTKKGTACKRRVKNAGERCWQHK
jgi:hypothetical protein